MLCNFLLRKTKMLNLETKKSIKNLNLNKKMKNLNKLMNAKTGLFLSNFDTKSCLNLHILHQKFSLKLLGHFFARVMGFFEPNIQISRINR